MAITSTSFIGGVQSDLIFGADVSTAEELVNVHINSDGSVARRFPLVRQDTSGGQWGVLPSGQRKARAYGKYWDADTTLPGSDSTKCFVEYGFALDPADEDSYTFYVGVFPIANDVIDVSAVQYLTITSVIYANFPEMNCDASFSPQTAVFNFGKNNSSGASQEFFYLYFDEDNVLQLRASSLRIRDFWGIGEGLKTRQPKANLTLEHKYHLWNSGWTSTQVIDFEAALLALPSIYDVPYYAKNNHALRKLANDGGAQAIAQVAEAIGGSGVVGDVATTVYDFAKNMDLDLPATHTLNSIAPTGMVKMSPFDRWFFRQSSSNLNGAGEEWIEFAQNLDVAFGTTTGISLPFDLHDLVAGRGIEFHLGRMFCSFNTTKPDLTDTLAVAPDFNDAIFYSQPLTNREDIKRMHSVLDPTSEDFTPTAGDGGWFILKRAGLDVALISSGQILYVLTDREVKAVISGGQGFTPTQYQTEDIASVGILSPDNVVEIPGGMAFLGRDRNVYAVQGTQIVNITDGRIQGRLSPSEIADDRLNDVRLVYDQVARRIVVQVPKERISQDYINPERSRIYSYNEEWVFQIERQAWTQTVYQLSTSKLVLSPKWSNTNKVVDDGRVNVKARSQELQRSTVSTDYIGWFIGVGTRYYRPEQQNDPVIVMRDDGTDDYPVRVVTNELMQTPSGRRSSTDYITSYFLRTEGEDELNNVRNVSNATVTIRADYEDSETQDPQNAYQYNKRDNNKTIRGKNVVYSKVNLRCNDDNFAIQWDGQPFSDFILLGYNVEATTNPRK